MQKKGHVVSPYLRNIFESREKELLNEPTLREIYINPETNKTYGLGELIKRPKLAESLEIIAKEGADAIYGGGSLMQPLLDDIEKFNGIIKEDDLRDYRFGFFFELKSKPTLKLFQRKKLTKY